MTVHPAGPDTVPVDFDFVHSLITLVEAAELTGLTVPVIRNWIKRGYRGRDREWAHLPATWTAEGKWLVRPIDVARAESATRARARRAAGG